MVAEEDLAEGTVYCEVRARNGGTEGGKVGRKTVWVLDRAQRGILLPVISHGRGWERTVLGTRGLGSRL